jgi:glycosyltransferase involved in cell wall biosynthesis
MRILYDHRIFSVQKFGGISRYFCELASNLSQRKGIEVKISTLYNENSYYESLTKSKPILSGINFKGKYHAVKFLNEIYTRHNLSKKKFDIFHPTYFDSYHIGKSPYVITVYDMIYEKYPCYFIGDPITEIKKTVVMNASKVIAISESTKKDIVSIYGMEPEKITVIPLATKFGEIAPSNMYIPKRYILFVGNRIWYKNFKQFCESISDILQEDMDLHLVFAGSSPFTEAEHNFLVKIGIANKTIYYPVNSDSQLSTLYRNALVFVFPSLYEGFGIPMLEAMECGCPIAASNKSSLPEVGGDAALYFDPTYSESISKVIRSIIYSDNVRRNLIQNGYIRAKDFSWTKTADATLKVYEEMLE